MCLRLSPGRRRVCEIDAPVWIFNLLHRAFDTGWMWNRLFIFLCLCFLCFLSFFLNWVCLHRAFEAGWMWCGMVCLFSLFLLSVFLFVCFSYSVLRPMSLWYRLFVWRNLACQDLGWFDYSLLFYLAEKGQQRIRLVWICIQATYSW